MTSKDEKKQGQCQYCTLADSALVAFWEIIARKYPQARGGDLSPHRTIGLHTAAAIAIEEWISNNVLPQEGDDPDETSEPIPADLKASCCRTCGSAIIFFVNDSNFHAGECGCCERRNYRNFAVLLETLTTIRNTTESLDYEYGDVMDELTTKEAALDEIRDLAYEALNRTRTSASA